jgi:tRNA(Ile)-lysidine synthase
MSALLSPYRDLLVDKKILLAYSGGVDSSALFHLLIDEGIEFDIAIVDYALREQSKAEVEYANELSKEYNLICHTKNAPAFESHFEANARTFRYTFFDELIKTNGYEILLTAHQLNDQLEWLLMRLTKGAGACELVGLYDIVQKSTYQLIRPLLNYTKSELQEYLDTYNYKYFIDSSNSDEEYERNYIRHNFSDKLVNKYSNGIKKSFLYLKNDISILNSQFKLIYSHEELRVIKLHDMMLKTKAVDLSLKELGYLLSNAQRTEIANNNNIVIGGKWAICVQNNIVYIAPYRKTVLPKEQKEIYRVAKVPPLIRSYCYEKSINIDKIMVN